MSLIAWIVIRVDVSVEMGLGHIARCMRVADALAEGQSARVQAIALIRAAQFDGFARNFYANCWGSYTDWRKHHGGDENIASVFKHGVGWKKSNERVGRAVRQRTPMNRELPTCADDKTMPLPQSLLRGARA